MLGTFCVILHLLVESVCTRNMSPKVVSDHYANITQFPHVVFLEIKCDEQGSVSYYGCGSAIVNQQLLLTAAHCLSGCSERTFVTSFVGHCNKRKGTLTTVASYMLHEEYREGRTDNDIALLALVKELQFSPKIKKVALMENPPYYEKASIAGWGYTCERTNAATDSLKDVNQYVWNHDDCINFMHRIPRGTFCASSGNEGNYPALGDSGSPLVVEGYIQIGIVSFKKPSTSRSVIVYTDVGYFYQWIYKYSNYLYCDQFEEVL